MAAVGCNRIEGEPVSRETILVVEEEARITEDEIGPAGGENFVRVVAGKCPDRLIEHVRAIGTLEAVSEDELPLRLHRARAVDEDVEVCRQLGAWNGDIV